MCVFEGVTPSLGATFTYLIFKRLRALFCERTSPVLLRFRYTEKPLELKPNSWPTWNENIRRWGRRWEDQNRHHQESTSANYWHFMSMHMKPVLEFKEQQINNKPVDMEQMPLKVNTKWLLGERQLNLKDHIRQSSWSIEQVVPAIPQWCVFRGLSTFLEEVRTLIH